MTKPQDDKQPQDLASIVASSGLFGTPAPAVPAKPSKDKSKNNPPSPSGDRAKPGSPSPAETTVSTDKPKGDARLQEQDQSGFDDPRQVFALFRGCLRYKPESDTNSKLNAAAVKVARSFKRLGKERDEAQTQLLAHASITAEPPTREELISIISTGLRDITATGSDVKGLTATLRDLMPELFRQQGDVDRPDPCALMAYICTFSGMTGEQIIAEQGGREFVEAQLSDILKTKVILPN
eukprot:GHVR01022181.1.p1 GENE.GHVR01022181.1~~GHVR01022181.1.p1  ORF type:complete len:238 (+),score=24.55 GHVR01022181.1:1053-1766(+)